ncbi:hypothetical protein [Pedobacter aquatilis]|uniref:hypothetical protein n=1 Tax=Pedobacter aquatilis TaxID=351343 RepID=UPI00292D79F0|nr:hypothetical protein [Pedobacter aquatilis]
MRLYFIHPSLKYIFWVCFSLLFVGCVSKKDESENPKYSIYILGKSGKEYLLQTSSLADGNLKPERDGVLLNTENIGRDTFVKNGFYYHLDRKTGLFSKFKIENNVFETVDSVRVDDFVLENFNWIDDNNLLLVGLNASGYDKAKFVLLDANSLHKQSENNINISKTSNEFKALSIGFVEKQADKLYMGYTFHASQNSNYLTSDTLYVSQYDFPSFKLVNTEKDTRSTYPGGPNTIQSYGFKTEKQDYFFMSCPGIALGNRPELSTGIFKLNADNRNLAKNYFFDISRKVKNHAYGMWYLGNNKAIIRAERKDLFTGLNDHYSKAHFEFYVIDLMTQSVNKLNLPLDKGTRREAVVVRDGTAYISINSEKKGNYIWLYNIKKETLKRGLKLSGDTDFILRIDKLID